MTTLNCWNNQLTSLPELPKSLEYLYCDHNQLTSLPVLPKSLKRLYCRDNNLPSERKEFYWAIQDFQNLFRNKHLNKYFI